MPLTIQEIKEISGIYFRSGAFPDCKNVEQVFVKISAGQEIGLSPISSMGCYDYIQNKLAPKPILFSMLIKRSQKYDTKILENTDTKCTIQFLENKNGKWEEIGTSSFTLDDAKKAALLDKPGGNYVKYPRNMLQARAMSNGFRLFTPDLSTGSMYTPEELGADVTEEGSATNTVVDNHTGHTVDTETGEIIKEAVIPPKPPAAPQVVTEKVHEAVKKDNPREDLKLAIAYLCGLESDQITPNILKRFCVKVLGYEPTSWTGDELRKVLAASSDDKARAAKVIGAEFDFTGEPVQVHDIMSDVLARAHKVANGLVYEIPDGSKHMPRLVCLLAGVDAYSEQAANKALALNDETWNNAVGVLADEIINAEMNAE